MYTGNRCYVLSRPRLRAQTLTSVRWGDIRPSVLLLGRRSALGLPPPLSGRLPVSIRVWIWTPTSVSRKVRRCGDPQSAGGPIWPPPTHAPRLFLTSTSSCLCSCRHRVLALVTVVPLVGAVPASCPPAAPRSLPSSGLPLFRLKSPFHRASFLADFSYSKPLPLPCTTGTQFAPSCGRAAHPAPLQSTPRSKSRPLPTSRPHVSRVSVSPCGYLSRLLGRRSRSSPVALVAPVISASYGVLLGSIY
ncbi:hypothetical protein NDU88_003977 [Pleurodeles waltl]|uniref:Uncharacterized protein n=1 Tax=Pleurodeles waltl TaxID=8319 RepID=A0AAV7QB93_PLEWA|nr:hypothetical protein NDU88_003977 [Pleurodeles waltl]